MEEKEIAQLLVRQRGLVWDDITASEQDQIMSIARSAVMAATRSLPGDRPSYLRPKDCSPGMLVVCNFTDRPGFLKVGEVYEVAQPVPGIHDHPQVRLPGDYQRVDMDYGRFLPA